MKKKNPRLWGKIHQEYGDSTGFARALSIHPSGVSRVVNGHVSLSPDEKQRWARLLNAEVHEVFPEGAE